MVKFRLKGEPKTIYIVGGKSFYGGQIIDTDYLGENFDLSILRDNDVEEWISEKVDFKNLKKGLNKKDKIIKNKTPKPLSKSGLIALLKSEQITLLSKYGLSTKEINLLTTETKRVNKLLELQKGVRK